MSALSVHQSSTFAAKNRFSRGFVLVQKGVSTPISKNEYLLPRIVVCTLFWAICSKMQCNMQQNALRFGAKRKVKWC